MWNTYGPTEATVVACAAQLTGEGPVRIGLPLDGWELAVVDSLGDVVPMGETGELVIGGVGLARYLDPEKDAEKYAPLASMGWARAYRSGDLVRAEPEGLVFVGRADEQVKLGGRRIELGEVDAALQALPSVAGAAAAVRRTKAGNQLLVGYVVPVEGFDQADAVETLRETLPAALVPLIAVVDTLPTRTSGKVDRAALPWPLADRRRLVRLRGDRGVAGRAVERDSRHPAGQRGRRLLRLRWRQPGRRAARVADPHPVPEQLGERHLPVPDAGCSGFPAVRVRRLRGGRPRCGADLPARRARAGAGHAAAAHTRRPALVGRAWRRSAT